MKKLSFLFLIGLISAGIASAIPQLINYQGFLTDDAGNPVADGNYSLTFRIYDVVSGGTALWTETHSAVSVTDGLFNVILGSVTPLTLPFDTDYWLGVQIEAEPELPRIQLTSVGYSYRAGTADVAVNAADADMVDGIHASTTPTANYLYPLGPDARFPESVLPPGLPPGPHASTHCPGGSDEITCFLLNTGPDTITASSNFPALTGINSNGHGLYGVATSSGSGVAGYGALGNGVYGSVTHNDSNYAGVLGYASGAANGVKGRSNSGAGVYGESNNGPAFQGEGYYGLHITDATYTGIVIDTANYGIYIDTTRLGYDGVWVNRASDDGYFVSYAGDDGYYAFNVGGDGFHVYSAGNDGYYAGNVGGDGVYIGNTGRHGVYVSDADTDAVNIYHPYRYGILVDTTDIGAAITSLRSGWHGGYFRTSNPIAYGAMIISAGASSTNNGLYVYGTFTATGTKSTVVETSEGNKLLFCVESPDVEFMVSGTGRLVNGEARVNFEPTFSEAISSDVPLKITVTPKGDWSGLYVVESSTEGFLVRSGAGAPNVDFDWIAIGRRRGYEVRPEAQKNLDAIARPVPPGIPSGTSRQKKEELQKSMQKSTK